MHPGSLGPIPSLQTLLLQLYGNLAPEDSCLEREAELKLFNFFQCEILTLRCFVCLFSKNVCYILKYNVYMML